MILLAFMQCYSSAGCNLQMIRLPTEPHPHDSKPQSISLHCCLMSSYACCMIWHEPGGNPYTACPDTLTPLPYATDAGAVAAAAAAAVTGNPPAADKVLKNTGCA